MKKILLSLFTVTVMLVMCLPACKKNEQPVQTTNVPDQEMTLLGNMTPFSLNNDKDKSAIVGFLQTARPFQLDLSRSGSDGDADLIRKAISQDIPVEVYVYKNTTKIARIKAAGSEVIKAFRKAQGAPAQPVTKENLPIIPSEAALNSLFSTLASANIPFAFATDGCYARAHRMRQMILSAGYDCAKFFAYGNLAASTGWCCVSWSYHVAPLVRFRNASGAVELRVLDPSLFTTPVTQTAWLNACRNTSCSSGAYVSSTRLLAGNVYYIASTGNNAYYDDNYVNTNCVLNGYSGLSGCGPAPTLNCPL